MINVNVVKENLNVTVRLVWFVQRERLWGGGQNFNLINGDDSRLRLIADSDEWR